MSKFNIKTVPSANTLYGSALAFIFAIALFLRTYFPYNDVFNGVWVKFKWYDSWYHIRLVENLVHHFPSRIQFDPYTAYPHGQDVFFAPFPDFLLGFFIWLFGAGSPSRELIETLGAYFPAIMGALVTIPVFFLGKELFNKKVGLIAAALVVIMPGQFLLKSLLGFSDHHVDETLFSSLTILFLILAIKNATQRGISSHSIKTKDWSVLRRPLLYSLLTGIMLGLYLLSWSAGAFFIFILLFFVFLQFISDHLRGRSIDYLCIICVPVYLIALLMVLPFLGQFGMGSLQVAALLIGILGLPLLSAISLMMSGKNIKRFYYPLVLASIIGILLAALHFLSPTLLDRIFDEVLRFKPAGGMLTIGEVIPLTLSMAWEEFTTGFYISLISLVVVAYFVVRNGAPEKMLFLVWSLLTLLSMFGQNRFAYYFAVNASLLTAYLSWKTASFIGTRVIPEAVTGITPERSSTAQMNKVKSKSSRKAKQRKAQAQPGKWGTLITAYAVRKYIFGIMAALIIFFLVYYPNIGMAVDVAERGSRPREAWRESLVWMRENTPDPFQDADFYYELYEKPPDKEAYDYPDSAYGVLAWWDYGHWITYIAHRIPNANPHQVGATEVARFFTAQDETSANLLIDELGSRYVIIDLTMALHQIDPAKGIYGSFYAMLEWTGKKESDFFDVYYRKGESGKLEPVMLYYPEYYKAMSSRLYIFEGKPVIPANSTLVISYSEKMTGGGVRFKEISSARRFATYGEAESFLASHSDDNYRIVGNDQFASPVPLEELQHYSLVHASPQTLVTTEGEDISEVKIFEYVP